MRFRRARRGLLLLELLLILLLLGALALVAEELFRAAIFTERDSLNEQLHIREADALVTQLRRDIWSATRIGVEPARLEITMPNGQIISWRAIQNTLLRTTNEGLRTYTNLPECRFSGTGAMVTLTFKTPHPESVAFVSQPLWLDHNFPNKGERP